MRAALVIAMALLAAAPAWAEKGSLGISVSVEAASFSLNPTLKSLKVKSVRPGSAADRAGLQPGDQLLAVDGVPVAGAKADAVRGVMDKQAGDAVRFLIQRGSEPPREVTAVLDAKP